MGAASQEAQAVPVVPVTAVGQAEGGVMEITVPGSGIWPPVVVAIDAADQIWLDQAEDKDHIVLDPADLDALIAALQVMKEQGNASV